MNSTTQSARIFADCTEKVCDEYCIDYIYYFGSSDYECCCGLRNHMEEEDCKKTNCNACCPLTKPQTNADRIRAMSDELLASQLVIVVEETIKALTDLDVPDEILNEVRSQLLERLKQPAEGE